MWFEAAFGQQGQTLAVISLQVMNIVYYVLHEKLYVHIGHTYVQVVDGITQHVLSASLNKTFPSYNITFWERLFTNIRTFHLSFKYHGINYTNTTSNEIRGIYKPHKTALYDKSSHICYQWNSGVCKIGCISTFDPTTCYLVDYDL